MNYQRLDDNKLLALIFTEGDRLSRAAVEEFVRRGGVIKPLSEIVSEQYSWTKEYPEWWAVVHATFILGAIGGKGVILPLLRGMRWAVPYDCD